MDNFVDHARVKRFKYQSYEQSLRDVHLTTAHNQARFGPELSDNDSHFHQSLEHWRQLNLSPCFLSFANKVDPLSSSMPLLLHNWREIVGYWIDTLESSDEEGLRPLLDLLRQMAYDLRTTLSPVYSDLLTRLLKLFPRSLPPATFTTLMESLSSFFKHLLVPAVGTILLEETWTDLCGVIRDCSSETQRAMAEVWASVLRRLKISSREKAVALLAQTIQGMEDATAWVFIFACKSVSQTLHTATFSILAPLIDAHIFTYTSDIIHNLIRRVLTALIHHVKNAEQYRTIVDLLISKFTALVNSSDLSSVGSLEHVRLVMEIVTIPCAVRGGSRLTQCHLDAIMGILPNVPLQARLHSALLKLATAAFTASDMRLWLGPGIKFLQQVWSACRSLEPSSLQFALNLNASLAELGWEGWKLVALPLVLKETVPPDILSLDPREIFAFFATLRKCKKFTISDTDLVWKGRVERLALDRLEYLSLDQERAAILELDDILTLSSFFSSAISPSLIKMVNCLFNQTLEDPLKQRRESTANVALALSICMHTLANRDIAEFANVLDLEQWMRISAKYWAWSHDVLGGVYSLSQANHSSAPRIPFEEVYNTLQSSLSSHCRPLRLCVLRLLSSNLILLPVGAPEVVRRCLQGEEVPLDMQGVRERVLRIGRVGQIIKDGDVVIADVAFRWLLAQLKVNLRPVWSPAAEALSSLCGRFGDTLWSIVLTELDNVSDKHEESFYPSWITSDDEGTMTISNDWEEERSWRDPSAHKLREVIFRQENPAFKLSDFTKSHSFKEHFNRQSYELQLLATLGQCSSFAEKHNRELVSHFLSLAGLDTPSRLPKQKLIPWLTLFSKFRNPRALYATDTLHSLYLSLLSHPDHTLQKIALSCLLTYRSPHLTSYDEKFNILLDEARWRDELTSLDLHLIHFEHRNAILDILIRLLFGIMLERRGRSNGADRRAAVLSALASCTEEELGLLVDLMLQPLNSNSSARQTCPFALVSVGPDVTERQQVGFLTLLGDVMKNIGTKLLRYWPSLIGTTIDLVGNAQHKLEELSGRGELAEVEEKDFAEAFEEVHESSSPSKVYRTIRQLGLKRLADFFLYPVEFDFTPYLPTCFSSFISPRVPSLDKENTQAPSALLGLFYSWSLCKDYIKFLAVYDERLLPKIYDCLVAPSVKTSVINHIFDIADHLLASSVDDEVIQETVVKPYISVLLSNLSLLVQRTKDISFVANPIAQRQTSILSRIAEFSEDTTQASMLLTLFAPLIRKPARFVPEKVKVDLLKTVTNLMRLIPQLSNPTSEIYQSAYGMLSWSFQSLRSRALRHSLVVAFQQLATLNVALRDVASLIGELNAYSTKRLDEPDFDRRLKAFASLNESQYKQFLVSDWPPIVYNMLYFIQDPTELAVRNNASFSLKHFIDLVANNPSSDFEVIFLRILYPGIRNGLRSKNEVVRVEILGILAYAVEKCRHLGSLQEIRGLLADGDEEANFFNNVLHVQIHRRSRALRRLADYCEQHHLRSSTLAEIFVPLVGNFLSSTAPVDHHLVDDAISTTGRMAKYLDWGPFHALVQKYVRISKDKEESEKVHVRTLVAILDSFHFPMEDAITEDENQHGHDGDDLDQYKVSVERKVPSQHSEATSASQTSKVVDVVSRRLLPDLLNYLEKRDPETDDDARIPISVGIVSIAKHLPAAIREPQINRLLTVLSQILRSKSQETRDQVRETLCRIAVSLGPKYMPLTLKELRSALPRGPQLHVLAYVSHALVVHVTSGCHPEAFGPLDDCVSDLARVSAEVIFGDSGKDVQAEDFKTKMREVRSSASKGLDTFALVARYITPLKISGLLLPLRSIMEETASLRVMNMVDEVLKRVAGGLNSNQYLTPNELLILCNTLITQNSKFLQRAPPRRRRTKKEEIVQVKRQEASESDHYSNNSFRFVSFGLDLLQTALRRNRFDYHDQAILARLDAILVAVGNTLYSTSSPVVILGLRCVAALVKCPLDSLEKSLLVFVRQSIDIIQQTGTTESEVVQAALKTLAAILRDGPPVEVREKDLVYLLELLSPDLEEPSRQASVFAILRAIVSRKFVVPEIYDLMDRVSEVMVTCQSSQVQELCRGVLLQFLLDYPQGKGRLKKQMTFLAKNLSYVHESGRRSVMELLGAIIIKFETSLIQEYTELLFVALVMVMANDESSKCREIAALLIKSLFSRLDHERRKITLSHVHTWVVQKARPQLVQVSCQVYGLITDVLKVDAREHLSCILEDLDATLSRSARAVRSLGPEEDDNVMDLDLDWQIPYQTFKTLEKILPVFPELVTQEGSISWDHVVAHLLYSHAWVRTAACRLLGFLFSAVPVRAPFVGPRYAEDHPLSLEGMNKVARKLCFQLKSEHLDQALGLQIVKNLFFIGKCFCAIPLPDLKTVDTEGGVSDGEGEGEELGENLLPWLFSKLSYQIRSAHIAKRNRLSASTNWSQQPLSIIRWFAAMTSYMEVGILEKFLVHILTPIYRLVEDDTIRDTQIEELKSTATELQDVVQVKVGTTMFSAIYNQIRQGALGARRERKQAKAVREIVDPEGAARRKLRRNLGKKESRKRKERGFVERRGKLKRRRAE